MPRLVFFALLLAALVALIPLSQSRSTTSAATADWPMYMHDIARAGNGADTTISTANAAQLTSAWTFPTGGVIGGGAAIVGNVAYIGSWDGNLYAIDVTTGAQLWKTSLGRTVAPACGASLGITSTPAVAAGVVYVGGGDRFWYALDASTGNVLWNVDTGDNSIAGGHYNWSSPLLYNGFAYIGVASNCDSPLVQGQLLKVNLTTHLVEHVFKAVPDGQVGGGIWTSPSIDPATNTVFVTTGTEGMLPITTQPHADAILAIDANTLALKGSWQIPINDAVSDSDFGVTPMLFTDAANRQLVGAMNKDGFLYVLDRNNLAAGLTVQPVWKKLIAKPGGTPQNGEGSVSNMDFDGTWLYVAGGQTTINGVAVNSSVRRVNPADGTFMWEQGTNLVLAGLAYANGIVVNGGGSNIEVRSAATGALLFSRATGSQIFGPPAIGGGRIIEGSTNGTIYALGFAGPPLASYAMESASWNGTAGEVVDSSGNGLNGTSVGGAQTANASPAIAGDPGSCRYATGFNGSTSYLSLGAPQLTLGGGLTVMAWVRWGIAPSTGNNWANIVSNNSNTVSDAGQFWLQHTKTNNAFEFAVQTTSSRTVAQSTAAPVQGAWQHVAGVYDGSTLTIYVNGVASGTASLTGNIVAPTSAYQLDIGRWAFNSEIFRSFAGDIDEVRVYSSALSAGGVAAAMNATHPCAAGGTPTPTQTPTSTTTPGTPTNTSVAATATSTPTATATTVPGGMSAYYAMESASWNGSPGEVVDSSGSGLNGTSVGGAQTANTSPAIAGNPGSCRYATAFNGSTSYLSLGAPQLTLGSGLTVMAWVRWGIAPGTGNSWANIVSNNSSTVSDSGQFWLQHNKTNNAFEFAAQTTNNRTAVQSTTAPVQGQWQHVTGVYDGSTLTIYVNGVASGTASLTGNIVAPTSAYQLDIGRWAFNSEIFRSFAGDIDEVRVYPSALSAAQVAAAMNATHPCAAGGTPTNTPTPTNTSVAATATSTPTATATTVPPTSTPTATATTVPGGMSAYYAMESASWNGTAGEVVDSSGSGLNGTSVGGAQTANTSPAIAGNPGSCRYATGFNGSTSYLSLGSPQLTLGSGLTVMAWVRWGIAPGTGNSWANIVSNNSSTVSDSGQFWLQHSQTNNAFEFAVETTNSRTPVKSATAPVQGAWQHVTGVYDGSTLTIYVNGVASGTASLTGNIVAPTSAYQLDIGRWAFNSETFRSFAGDIDEVRVYPSALSAAQVAAAMNATHPCAVGTPTATPTATSTTTPGAPTNTPTPTPVPPTSTPTATGTPVAAPLAYYAMESASWNGTAGEVVDSSGSGLNGTSVGGAQTANTSPAIAGNPGSCRYATGFNGSTSYLSLGSPQLALGSGLTVMAWVRWGIAPGTGNNWANIVSNNSNTVSDAGQFWLQHNKTNNAFEFAVQTTNNRSWAQSTTAPVQGAWQHVAGVYDGSTLTIYVNGVASGTASLTGNIVAPTSAYQLDIGRWAFNSEIFRSFAGDIDEVRVYSSALSAAQVAASMNATHPCGP